MDGRTDRQRLGRLGGVDEEAERGPGVGGQRFTYQVALQEGCGREGREKETEKTCEKRPKAGAHAPPPHHPRGRAGTSLSAGGQQDPPNAHPPLVGSATDGIPALAGGAAEGLVGAPPRRPPLTFASLFLELEGVRGLFLDLMACSLVLWGCRSAVRGDPCPAAQPPCTDPSHPPVPFAWSLSSWLAVFFQSSILSCKGFIRLSMRALEQGERSRECERVPESGGIHSPSHPTPSQHPASPSSAKDEPGQAVSPIVTEACGFGGKADPAPSYLVNWRSLASMLRCLMHIRVRAEPMSLVAPGGDKALLTRAGTPPQQSQPSLYSGSRVACDRDWDALGIGDALGRGWLVFSP